MSSTFRKPLQIGVTGGIGSGKSIVCKIFSCLGVSIYNADDRAKWITNFDPEVRERVIALLGVDAYDADGQYNRPFVASLVFKNEALLKSLNAIIHPAVMRDTEKWVNTHQQDAYIIKEAAIMKKAGEGNSLDFVIVVNAPTDLRIKRVLQRDKRSESEIRAIIDKQISDEEREQIADFTIDNDETSALIPQVLRLHQHFSALSQ